MNEKEIQKENCCDSEFQKDKNNSSEKNKNKSCDKKCDKCPCDAQKSCDNITDQLKTEKKELQKKLSELEQFHHNEKLKYQADLDNFQKRIQKEKINSLKYASVNLITEILNPLEQLEKVLEMSTEEPLLKNFLLGFKMIHQQIKEILHKDGVQEIKALGEQFNPEFHHAIEKISDKNQPNGINLAVLQKGFLYKDLVIRPVMVKINEWSEKNNENK